MNDDIFAETFWNNLENEIKNQGYTLRGFCFSTGINENSLRAAKSRKQMPLLNTAYQLAKELNVSLEYLITGKEPSEKIPDDLQNIINKYAEK